MIETDFIVVSFLLRLAKGLVALTAVVGFLWWLDRRADIDFAEFARDLKKAPLAAAQYLGLRFLGACLILATVLGCAPAQAFSATYAAPIPATYDAPIRRAVDDYWAADYPFWRAWKAQLYQESRFRPEAVSPAGARGLAQFMGPTWDMTLRQMGRPWIDPHDARTSIEAGAFYMMKLRRQWSSPRPADDRQRLAQASYNAGLGSILKAQAACGGALAWAAIAPCLPRITGRHAKETTDYVRLIARWRARMEAAP